MTTQKINHTPSFLNQGIFVNVLLLLHTLSFAGAQQETPPPSDKLSISQKFNPSMAIIMVVLVSAFFLMGFFSVYVRQCAQQRFHGANYDPAVAGIEGGGRRSWRRPGHPGLDLAVIETFPTFVYSTVKGLKIGKGSLECAVCLNEFEDEETLRLIPKCSHVFHPDCIDAWLNSHTTCPVCRANLVPKPGDMPSLAVHLFKPDNNPVEPDPGSNVNDQTQNQHAVHIPDNNDQIREVPQMRSPDVNLLLNPTNQTRPPKSWSTGWRFSKLLPRSHSTGHSLVQPAENCERFSLRLPEQIRSQLMDTHLNRTKSCSPFYGVRSPRRAYRSRSGGVGRGGNNSYYERFDRGGQPDRWGFTTNPPFIARTGSLHSSNGDSDELNATPPKNFLRSVKQPFDRLFHGTNSNNNIIVERSSDWLRHDNQV